MTVFSASKGAVPGRWTGRAGPPEASLDEHAEILDAMMAGDTAAAEQATRRHVARALESALPG